MTEINKFPSDFRHFGVFQFFLLTYLKSAVSITLVCGNNAPLRSIYRNPIFGQKSHAAIPNPSVHVIQEKII